MDGRPVWAPGLCPDGEAPVGGMINFGGAGPLILTVVSFRAKGQ